MSDNYDDSKKISTDPTNSRTEVVANLRGYMPDHRMTGAILNPAEMYSDHWGLSV